jgi:hypothetical protein
LDIPRKLFIIESIKSSRSPKLALNGAKLLYGGDESWGEIHKECFEATWADATKMNRLIEKKSGNIRWPERFEIDADRIKDEARNLNDSKYKMKEWGRILSTYGETTLIAIQKLVTLP